MVALPQLIIVDGLLMPTVLPFSVPAIPRAMLVKVLYYINNQDTCTHVWIFQEEREDQHSFYVLKKDNEYGAKTITPKLIELFEAARGGVKDKRIKDHASLLAVCDVLGEELQRPSAVRPVVMWCARGWHQAQWWWHGLKVFESQDLQVNELLKMHGSSLRPLHLPCVRCGHHLG